MTTDPCLRETLDVALGSNGLLWPDQALSPEIQAAKFRHAAAQLARYDVILSLSSTLIFWRCAMRRDATALRVASFRRGVAASQSFIQPYGEVS